MVGEDAGLIERFLESFGERHGRQGAMADAEIYLGTSENKTPVLIFLAVSCKCSDQIGPID